MQQNTSSLAFARFASVTSRLRRSRSRLMASLHWIGCLRGRKAREEECKERLQGRYGLFHFHIYERDVKIMNTLTNGNRWLDVYSCVIFAYIIGTLRSNDATATRTSLKRWICVISVFIAIIPIHLLCQL